MAKTGVQAPGLRWDDLIKITQEPSGTPEVAVVRGSLPV